MGLMSKMVTVLVVALILLSIRGTGCYGELQVGFCDGKCGRFNVEGIVGAVVAAKYLRDPKIVAANLLRSQFHDCFVKVLILLVKHIVSSIQDRLYNFQNTGQPDPTLNATLARMLRLCFICEDFQVLSGTQGEIRKSCQAANN
ncbi:hypothetical protein FEM48_Zijuj02G0002000 [Ziziphus jujuba var. spinosa]|uniref:Peroxidase n=1 Tax=Ziziphus jujuba var. spinosa TaxID=714518 RepID=A0A978VSG6_ZIZJJ|nr:hypothetical protein FEM48_Zijuj02G0002000 [Ziziphus jujuba var. spinosa]